MPAIPPVAALLERTALFGTLDEADRQAVAAQMRKASFQANELIFSRGEPGREIYLVIEGRVRLSILSSAGREVSYVPAGPGDIFGEIAVLDGGPRTASATAATKVEAMTLTYPSLKHLTETHPQIARGAIAFLCARVRESAQQIEAIALHSIEVRLGRYLLELARKRGPAAERGRVALEIGMSQGDLAMLLGASRPKVNEALSALERNGILSRHGTHVSCNVEALVRIAGPE